MTEQERIWFKQKLKGQLDCSPKPTFEQRCYREYVSRILLHHPKYTVIRVQNKGDVNSFSIKNLLLPFYSYGCSGKGLKDRMLRWLKWYRRITEGRELIENHGEWSSTYR